MANDGIEIVLTLEQVVSGSNTPTGLTKANVMTDPDYISPFFNTASCPITYNTSCPVMTATAQTGTIIFEFSLPNSVVKNPNLTGVMVLAITASGISGSTLFNFPNNPANFFSGSVGSGMKADPLYTLALAYMSGSATYSSCSYTSSFYTVG